MRAVPYTGLLAISFLSPSLAAQPAPAPQAQAQPQRPSQTGLARLKSNIEQITSSIATHWGIYIKCLDTNEEIAINADQQMDTMSVIKVPLMVEAFRQIGEGKFSLADRYILKDSDKRPGTGVIRSFDEGASLTVKDLLTLMIIVSDNTATDAMFSKVGGPQAVNALMQQYGLNSIRATGYADDWFKALAAAGSPVKFHAARQHPFGLSSPRDMGRLLEKIANGQAVSQQASDQMLGIMRGQLYRTRLPKYVSGFQLAHKTGDFVPWIANDVGLL
ncbi:MAG TPA: serine hydrolase, partial [Terriglobales bacterium]|nr:serine hydrolase [Terriglobales bacterium]